MKSATSLQKLSLISPLIPFILILNLLQSLYGVTSFIVPINVPTNVATHTRTSPINSVKQSEQTDCLVIGSGISGSCLSFHLAHNHNITNIIMAEKNQEVGGNVISKSIKDEDGEFVWEEVRGLG
jgi:hypothetical protein